MEVDLQKQSVSLSVGELSEFSTGPGQRLQRKPGRWRTQVGLEWHQEQEKASRKAGEVGQYEVSLRVTWPYRGWKFNLQGRIDQWIEEEDHILIREIKTTGFELPADVDELLRHFPSYFTQLGTYLALLSRRKDLELPFRGEMLFINIDDGIRQRVREDGHCADLFHARIHHLWKHLVYLQTRRGKFRGLPRIKAFANLREGQETIERELKETCGLSPVVFFQAPTGFGKTGVALELALNEVVDGHYDRVLYLTSKSSGQPQVMQQLKSMLPEAGILSTVQIRNKDELCSAPACRCDLGDRRLLAGDRWKACGLSPHQFINDPAGQPGRFRDTGEKERICPYELMRATLPYAEVWVGDLNYLFSPRNRSLFFEQPGFDLSGTLLILDEAHNLASRVADVFSYRISHNWLEQWHAELQFSNSHPALRRALESWLDLLEKVTPADLLADYQQYEARDCSEQFAAALQNYPLHGDSMSEDAVQGLWDLADAESFFKNSHLEKLIWSPHKGILNLSCLDASREIGSMLGQCGQAILMSATLEPQPYFLKQLGLASAKIRPRWVEAKTPWRHEAYSCAVDLRVDTRYKNRQRHAFTTAETLAHCVQSSPNPVVTFFPSYQYAESMRRLMDNEFPQIRVAMQKRGGPPEEQARFIDDSLAEAHLIFLIMGSVFAEGIDHLGGAIDLAVIVGPALPEVNALQKKRMKDREDLGREAAFEEVYQVPGMQKINQALGRLVRAPGQSARILFHCRRFAEPSYQDLLMEDFRSNWRITRSEELIAWLRQS